MLKEDKLLYKPGAEPVEIVVPPLTFIELSGAGRPDSPEFAEVVSALYGLAYTVRMAPHAGLAIPGYRDFSVYPLEGVWDLDESGRQAAAGTFGVFDKDRLVYRMMIRQPDFVTTEIFPAILEQAVRKKANPLLPQVRLTRLTEGLCVQLTHIGPFDAEPVSMVRMQAYCDLHGLRRRERAHREIYMSDPRRTAPAAARTVLRWTVETI